MKKLLSLLLAAAMLASLALCFTACGESGSDLDYIKKKGTLIVGITDFEPMDYQAAGSDEWIGFDADMAKAFAESIGVKAEFVIIDWDSKVTELNNKTIDCVWNGMTLSDGVKAAMETSKPYCNNNQVVVLPADRAADFQTVDSIKTLKFAVEAGSAGEDVLKGLGCEYVALTAQSDALMEVAAGTSDACVIDLLMAGAMVGEGTSYPNLTYTAKLNEAEEYGVGFRKGSDAAAKLNEFFKTTFDSGKMKEVATTYGVQESLIAQ